MDFGTDIRNELSKLISQETALKKRRNDIERDLAEIAIKTKVYRDVLEKFNRVEGQLEQECIDAAFDQEAAARELNTLPSEPRRGRMSVQMSTEVWQAIREFLSDGSLRKVADIKLAVEGMLNVGEINRTTIQSILSRYGSELEKPEMGYYRLKQ